MALRGNVLSRRNDADKGLGSCIPRTILPSNTLPVPFRGRNEHCIKLDIYVIVVAGGMYSETAQLV
jgi:hypothetical protein